MTSPSAGFPADLSPAQILYPDLKSELATTRRVLERVPDDAVEWTPHEKSTPIGRLATHLSQLPRFAAMIMESPGVDVLTVKWPNQAIATTAERLEVFDTVAADMQERVARADWASLQETWTMRAGDHVMFTETKGILLRTLGLSHMAHHRAQLGVYLRLRGVAVPSVYGPTADEQ